MNDSTHSQEMMPACWYGQWEIPASRGGDPETRGTLDGYWDGANAREPRVSVTGRATLHLKAYCAIAIAAIRHHEHHV